MSRGCGSVASIVMSPMLSMFRSRVQASKNFSWIGVVVFADKEGIAASSTPECADKTPKEESFCSRCCRSLVPKVFFSLIFSDASPCSFIDKEGASGNLMTSTRAMCSQSTLVSTQNWYIFDSWAEYRVLQTKFVILDAGAQARCEPPLMRRFGGHHFVVCNRSFVLQPLC